MKEKQDDEAGICLVKGRGKEKVSPEEWSEKLINAYVQPEPDMTSARGLHVSRTLDQFYYHSLKDTKPRDRDQELRLPNDSEDYLICIVDQLWLWVIDESGCPCSSICIS